MPRLPMNTISSGGRRLVRHFSSSESKPFGFDLNGNALKIKNRSKRFQKNIENNGNFLVQQQSRLLASAAQMQMDMSAPNHMTIPIVSPIMSSTSQNLVKRDELKARLKYLRELELTDLVTEVKAQRERVRAAGSHPEVENFSEEGLSEKNLFVMAMDEHADLDEAVSFMKDRQASSIFVVDSELKVKGFLTRKDLLFNYFMDLKMIEEASIKQRQAQEEAKKAGKAAPVLDYELSVVADIMRPIEKIAVATPNTKVLQALKVMKEKSVRHLPIIIDTAVDNAGKKVKKSISDVVKNLHLDEIEHIASANGIIRQVYDALVMPQNVSNVAELITLEAELSASLRLPSLKNILSQKPARILNTDIKDGITVSQAVEEMKKNNVGYVVVRNMSDLSEAEEKDSQKTELVGILTAGGILKRVLAAGKDPKKTLVKDVMIRAVRHDAKGIITEVQAADKQLCQTAGDTPLLTCMRLMTLNDLRYMVVTNSKGTKIRGVITNKDVVEALLSVDYTLTD